MNKTTMLIVGGLAIAGIFLLVAVSKEGAGNSAPSVAVPAALGVPAFPAAPPMPAFQVEASPTYMYFNMPLNRDLIPPGNSGKNGCACENECGDDVVAQTAFPQSFINESAARVASRFSFGSDPSSIIKQFPPALYPWLYQKGGSA